MSECTQQLVDVLADAVVVVDSENRIKLWNAAAASMFGVSLGKGESPRFEDLCLPLLEENLAPISQVSLVELIQRRTKNRILGMIRPDGSVIWLAVSTDRLAGDKSRFAIVFHDVTEAKRIEDALRESREKFLAVAETMGAALGIVCGTRFVYANRYFAQLSGYTIAELLTKNFPELVHPDFRQSMLESALRRQRGELGASRYDFKMITKTGEPRWVDFSVTRTMFNGQPALIGIGFDITDRKKAEATLRESEAKLKAFLDNSPLLMGVVDLLSDNSDTIHVYDNPASCRFLGVPKDTTDRRSSELGVPREVFSQWVGHYREAERRKEPVHFEYQDYHAGSPFWAEVTIQYVGRTEQGCSRFIYVAQDITKRRQDHEELKKAKALAESANAAKDQFLAVLSHELRTPLAPALGGIYLMERQGGLPPKFREMLQMIHRNIAMEARLIDDLLDVTRIARGKISIHRNMLDIREAIESAVQVCRGELEARHLRLNMSLCRVPLFIMGDSARLQQVFWNLLKNAIKFTPDGGEVTVRTYRENEKAVVEVQDSGIGIAEEDLERIFNVFEQAEPQGHRLFGGLGLGLAISKRLVEMHEGTISAHSRGKGTGALFRVVLPIAVVDQKVRDPAISPPVSRGNDKLILVVEDHHDTALMMKAILESFGYVVEIAPTATQALEAARNKSFDLLISDLGLPDRSGLELMQELRKTRSRLKGIALSGYGSEEDIRRCKEAGFSEHVTKPVDTEVLIEALERVM